MLTHTRSSQINLGFIAVLALTATVYWPVSTAGFAWDDFKFLLDSGWMTDSSRWADLLVHGFPEWATYYRPLGVALYIVETNLSGFKPAPMHFLSLAIHLCNVALVGLLARAVLREVASGSSKAAITPVIAMSVYAVHPALVEPVVWISAQYDLLTTGFTLLGLFLNMHLKRSVPRAGAVASCFFLAACGKEAALSFPFLLVVVDWLLLRQASQPRERGSIASDVRTLLARQWGVYAAVFGAGLAYLVLRIVGLGFLVNPTAAPSWSFWPQVQTACFTYVAYWKLIVWPMSGLAPMYQVATDQFATISPKLLAMDATAVVIIGIGLRQFSRGTAFGALLVGVTAALLPVLHIAPQEFAGSLYHCRYAMTAIGIACMLLPSVLREWKVPERRPFARVLACAAGVWLLFAVVNTRICIPLWSDDVKLWQWALVENPGSIQAQESLLGAYIRTQDYDRARPLADRMMQSEARASFGSMLDVAVLRIALRDVDGASLALDEARKRMNPSTLRHSYLRSYMLLSGQLAELKNDRTDAEEAYRAAISFEPQLPEGYMRLAILKARAGAHADARALYEKALSLYTPTDRARIEPQFAPLFAEPAPAQ